MWKALARHAKAGAFRGSTDRSWVVTSGHSDLHKQPKQRQQPIFMREISNRTDSEDARKTGFYWNAPPPHRSPDLNKIIFPPQKRQESNQDEPA